MKRIRLVAGTAALTALAAASGAALGGVAYADGSSSSNGANGASGEAHARCHAVGGQPDYSYSDGVTSQCLASQGASGGGPASY